MAQDSWSPRKEWIRFCNQHIKTKYFDHGLKEHLVWWPYGKKAWWCNKRMLKLWQSLPGNTRSPRQLQYLNDRKHRAAKKPQQSPDRNTSYIRHPWYLHDTLTCKADTGAGVTVFSNQDYDRLNPNPQQRHLDPTRYNNKAYRGYTIKTLRSCPLYVHQNGSIKEVIFNVTDVPGLAMLGCKTCEEL